MKSIEGLFCFILIRAISKSVFFPMGGVEPKRAFFMFCFSNDTTGAAIRLNCLQIVAYRLFSC